MLDEQPMQRRPPREAKKGHARLNVVMDFVSSK